MVGVKMQRAHSPPPKQEEGTRGRKQRTCPSHLPELSWAALGIDHDYTDLKLIASTQEVAEQKNGEH